MPWYDGTYSCGHEGTVNITGPSKDRQRKADYIFSGLCPECYKKQLEKEKEEKDIEAARKAKEMDLPELSGTEKQVAWANTLRMSQIEKLNERFEKIEAALKEKGLDVVPGENVKMGEVAEALSSALPVNSFICLAHAPTSHLYPKSFTMLRKSSSFM